MNGGNRTARPKATHRGRCQACDSKQKLPAGVLAAHGYTTRWGFFAGVCPGSGHMPFERSTDLIARCIATARAEAAALCAEADAAEANTDPENVDIQVYFGYIAGGGAFGHRWIKTRLGIDPATGRVGYWHPGDSRPPGLRPMPVYTGFGLAAAVRDLTDRRAGWLREEAGRRDTYAAWQEARIAGWKPAELTPVD